VMYWGMELATAWVDEVCFRDPPLGDRL
jgi:hypothetical protein